MLRFLRIALGSLVCLWLANSASFAQSVPCSTPRPQMAVGCIASLTYFPERTW